MREKTILCVDDEQHVLNSLKRLLRKEDYQFLTANSGQEGLDLLKEHQLAMSCVSIGKFLPHSSEWSPNTVRQAISQFERVNENKMSAREKEMLRNHVIKGETLLQMVPNLTQAALFVRHHHEPYKEGRLSRPTAGKQHSDRRPHHCRSRRL